LGDGAQRGEGLLGGAALLRHDDPEGLVDDRSGRQRDPQLIGQRRLVIVAQRRGQAAIVA
jgi:hypothetical protein